MREKVLNVTINAKNIIQKTKRILDFVKNANYVIQKNLISITVNNAKNALWMMEMFHIVWNAKIVIANLRINTVIYVKNSIMSNQIFTTVISVKNVNLDRQTNIYITVISFRNAIRKYYKILLFNVMDARKSIKGKKMIISIVWIVLNVIKEIRKNGFIVKDAYLVTKATNKSFFIVNIVENAIKDLNRIHFIVLMIINVIQFLKTIFIVKNVKAVI